MPAQGKVKGHVLLSYITSPFTLFPWERKSDPHSSYWEAREIARLFSERGYAVDAINASDHRFVPQKSYVACIDIQQDLERLSAHLPASCKKVIHIDNPYYKTYNEREARRLAELKARRGATLAPRRTVASYAGASHADFFEGLGNESVHATFKSFGKQIFPIPISVSQTYDFPHGKDFDSARTHFIYFGGGGAVLKGLDLTIEAFARLPHLTLHIVGPAAFEDDFAAEYTKELSLPNIIRHNRPKTDSSGNITVDGKNFLDLANTCVAIVYPSAAEGTSGAVIQAVHAGLIPVVTPETGLNPAVGGILLTNPTTDSVTHAVETIAITRPDVLRNMAKHSWSFVREHHTRESFSVAYAAFIDNILKL